MVPFTPRTGRTPGPGLVAKYSAEAAAGARRTSRLVIAADDVQLRGRMAVARCLRAVISLADG